MEEGQRFLRYIVPGLTLIIESLGYLLISGDIRFSDLIGLVNTTGAALSVFLASGVFGFLLGVIYYTGVWCERLEKGADLRPILEQAEYNRWLKLSCCGKAVETTKLTKRGAWRVVASYLNMRKETSKRIKGAIRGMDRLSDILNSSGTTCLASVLALVPLFVYDIKVTKFSGHYGVSVVIWIAMLLIHSLNYMGVIKDYESVFGSILLSEFERECKHNLGLPIKLYLFQNDLKKECLKAIVKWLKHNVQNLLRRICHRFKGLILFS